MASLMQFVEAREAFLQDSQRVAEYAEARDMCRREISLFRALTDSEFEDLDAGVRLPTRERVEELAQRCGYRPGHCESILRGVGRWIGKPLPPRPATDVLDSDLREFVVDLTAASSFDDFTSAFNRGFCERVGGTMTARGSVWSAFHDFLFWPTEDPYRLVLRGWSECAGLSGEDRNTVLEILRDNPHVRCIFE